MPPTVTTWPQVIDDAVKIGLGALIGGLFTWLVARHNAQSAIQKLIFERRSKILSDAAQVFDSLFQALVKYSNQLCGLAGVSVAKPTDPREEAACIGFMFKGTTEAVNSRIEMTKALEQSVTAQSQLMLLGEDECHKKADALCAAIIAADASFHFDGRSFTVEHWNTTTKWVVRDCREAFYKEMQKAFRKM